MNKYNPDSQRLFISDILNCRDLGGMPVSSGSTTLDNIFIRSGSPALISDKAKDILKTHGVRTVIDLRSVSELKTHGNPFEHDDDVRFYSVPLFVGNPESDNDPVMDFLRTHHLGDFYIMMLNELGPSIVKVLRILKDNKDGICLFHCAHGKDRTGVIAAIIYLLAGASEEDIITNYKISYDYARFFLDPLIEKKSDDMKHTLRSDAINMQILLDYIIKEYNGDIKIYLRSNGMDDKEINELRDRIVKP